MRIAVLPCECCKKLMVFLVRNFGKKEMRNMSELSPRGMRRLGDWVVATHEEIEREFMMMPEAVDYATRSVGFDVSSHDLMDAYHSVEIPWRKSAKVEAAELDIPKPAAEAIAAMSAAIQHLCACKAKMDVYGPMSKEFWEMTSIEMNVIRDRFSQTE